MRLALAILLLTPTLALAQQPIASPSQLALQIDNAIGIIAQRAELAEQQVATLKQQVSELQKQLEELRSEKANAVKK